MTTAAETMMVVETGLPPVIAGRAPRYLPANLASPQKIVTPVAIPPANQSKRNMSFRATDTKTVAS